MLLIPFFQGALQTINVFAREEDGANASKEVLDHKVLYELVLTLAHVSLFGLTSKFWSMQILKD